MGFLTDHCAHVRLELAGSPLDANALRARAEALPKAKDFVGALRAAGVPAVIAEVKRASPSEGVIREADPAAQAARYQTAGATAISVLTEARHFLGSIDDVAAVCSVVDVPVMRKDFIVHPDQLTEARAHGADAALLIATVLTDAELGSLLEQASNLGMGTLVEAFGEEDLARAIDSGADVVGINARDLESLEIDVPRALRLLSRIPQDRVRVFESGISSRDHVRDAVDAGADAILVGTALMRADDPGAKLREMVGEVA